MSQRRSRHAISDESGHGEDRRADGPELEPVLRTVTKPIPVKKLILVAEMSLVQAEPGQPPSKHIHPSRFATTLQETGLLD